MFKKSYTMLILQAALLLLATTVPTETLLTQETKIPEHVTIIDKLPYEISESGNYGLSHDLDATHLKYQYAIAIVANDVNLDLGHHVLTLNASSKGILARDVSNVSIHNGTIMADKPTGDVDSWGLELHRVTHATVDKLTFLNTCVGAFVTDCTDQHFADCTSDRNFYSLWIDDAKGVTIRDCDFNSEMHSINVYRSAEDLSIHRCSFHVSVVSCINLYGDDKQTSNVEIDDCTFQLEHFDYMGATIGIKLGGAIANAKVRNCTFLNNGEPSPAVVCSGTSVDVVVEGCSTPLNKIKTRKPQGFSIW